MDILDFVHNVDVKDVTSILTPVFVGLPLLYLAVRADRPHKTASILLIWFLHVPIYLFSLWSAKPVEFAREITLTILLNALLTILIVVTILLVISFLIWGAWRLSYVSLPKSRRKWMARPPSFRDLKIKIDAALSHAFFHMISHPKVRRLLRDPNLRTHSMNDIGWLLRDKETYVVFCTFPSLTESNNSRSKISYAKAPAVIDKTKRFRELFDSLPPPRLPFHLSLRMSGFRKLPQNIPWMNLSFLLIPGLFTQSYPGYMSALRKDLQLLGLHVFYDLNDKENGSEFDTDKSTEHNARALRDEVLRLAGTSRERKIVAIGHSKGAVDFAAALSLYPEIQKHVACHISIQGPHGGTPLVNDLMKTYVQKDLALAGLHYILGANHEALIDMTYVFLFF